MGVEVDAGIDAGMGTVHHHGLESLGPGTGDVLMMMDSRQRAWEKRVRTLVDRR